LSVDWDGADWVGRSPSPAMIVDPRGQIVAANAAMECCLKVTTAALGGQPLAAWAKDPAALSRFLREPTQTPCEFVFRAADGHEHHLRLSIAKKAFADRDLVTATDMTSHHLSEQSLRRERDQYLDMISAGSDWFWEHRGGSRGTIRLFRTRREEDDTVTIKYVDRQWPDEVADKTYDPEGFAEWCRKQDARESYRDYVMRVLRGDGVEQYLRVSAVPYADGSDVYRGFRGVSVDVTRQVLAERALRDSEARLLRSEEHLRHAQRVVRIGSIEHELGTGIQTWSDEMYSVLGIERQTLLRSETNFIKFVHEADRDKVERAVVIAKSGKSPRPGEVRMVRRDGETRTIYIDNDLIHDGTGKPLLFSVFKDVTEQRRAEERQKEMEQQLLQAQKLEALGTLAGGVAHELNNTLVPVLGLAKLTIKRLPEGSREQSNLITILRAGEKARDLVERIVAFSRKEGSIRVEVDLGELAHKTIELLRHGLPSTIIISEQLEPVPLIMGDPKQLPQVIIDLVMNAVQAISDRTGTVAVEVAMAAGERLPHVPEHRGSSVVRLSVTDNGRGMDGATLARIFEPFFTTREVGAGAGLGLSVVHGIVTQHGGHIAVESEPGRGTRFDVFLPGLVVTPVQEVTLSRD
jgi:PAS domain S-box-containing protein